MNERLRRGLSPVLLAEQPCGTRFVESRRLIIPDKTMNKRGLLAMFNGQDVEHHTWLKLSELGFIPQNEEERKMLGFLDHPLVHKYPSGDSPARYFMEVIVGNHAILASYLPPNSITSDHKHSAEHGIFEDYHLIGGESRLRMGTEVRELKYGMFAKVPLDTSHQLETGKKPAFILIIMKNAGLVKRENWHR